MFFVIILVLSPALAHGSNSALKKGGQELLSPFVQSLIFGAVGRVEGPENWHMCMRNHGLNIRTPWWRHRVLVGNKDHWA